MTYVFLDTMIYLHYKWFEDIDFTTIVGDQKIQIVVPHITLNELDKHKDYHKSFKVRRRAKKVADKFLECFLNDKNTLKGELSIRDFEESTTFDFWNYNLNSENNDHRLLAAIYEFKKSTSDPVLLISQDVGPRLTAKRLKIKTLKLSSDLIYLSY